MLIVKTKMNRIRFGALYVAIMLSLVPLFNVAIGGRGFFLYLGIGLVFLTPFIPHRIILNRLSIAYILFASYDLFTVLWSHNTISILDSIQVFELILLIIFIDFSDNEVRLIQYCQLILGLVIVLILSFTSTTMIAYGVYATNSYRAILNINGVQIDPNYTCMLMFPIGIYLFKNIMDSEIKSIFRILSCLLLLLVLYAYLRSGSRGGLLAIIGGCLFYFIFRKDKFVKKLVIVVVVCIILSVALPIILSHIDSIVLARFSIDSLLNSGGSGRIGLWVSSLSKIFDSPALFLFGHGKLATINDLGIASHNFFIDAIYNGGLVQLCFLINFYVAIYRRASKNNNTYVKSLLISYICMTMTVSVGTNMYYWVGMIVLMVISNSPEIRIGGKK